MPFQGVTELIRLQRVFRSEGLTFVGHAKYASDAGALVRFVATAGINYPVVMSSPELERSLGGIEAIPSKYLVDREGQLVGRFFGAQDGDALEAILRPLVRGSSAVRAVARAGRGSVTLAWPAAEIGYELESAEDPVPGAWTLVPTPVQVVNGENVVTLPTAGAARFFRLTKP